MVLVMMTEAARKAGCKGSVAAAAHIVCEIVGVAVVMKCCTETIAGTGWGLTGTLGVVVEAVESAEEA